MPARQEREVAAVQPDRVDFDASRREARHKPDHLSRPFLGVVRVDQERERIGPRLGEAFECLVLAFVRLAIARASTNAGYPATPAEQGS